MISVLLTTPVLAVTPPFLLLDSFWMADPLFDGKSNPNAYKHAEPGDDVPGYWWRDTTNQNANANHWGASYPPNVHNVAPEVFLFRGFGISNVVMLIGTDGVIIIDSWILPKEWSR